MHRALITVVSVLTILTSALAASPAAAATRPPRVVIIVGPVGELTDAYRAYGRAAAREAARWTSDVVTIASPNATWPAVRKALQGASIVVYLGHGNGFPSPYRSELFRGTQNGLGLNPVAGVDDVAHQYFGESFIADKVRLAPDAVVILSHLRHASGNSEPGGPEPTIDVAGQRADNFAAGWLAAGARAVIADALAPTDYYIHRLFASKDSAKRMWQTAPTRHGHDITIASARTPNATVLLDPTKRDKQFYRSLVSFGGGRPTRPIGPTVASGTAARPVEPVAPSLAAIGVQLGVPALVPAERHEGLVAGRTASLVLPMVLPGTSGRPPSIRLGLRWQPLDPPPTAPVSSDGAQMTDVSGPPPIELVAPEQPGSLVSSVAAELAAGGLRVTVGLPAEPGRYRLTTTIHDTDDVAYDAATQAQVAALVVQVSRPVSIDYALAARMTVEPGEDFELPLRLANTGSLPWAEPPVSFDPVTGDDQANPGPVIDIRWLPLGPEKGETDAIAVPGPRLGPGQQGMVTLSLSAPRKPGTYMVLIDLVSPLHGSLAAAGASFAETRITVQRSDRATAREQAERHRR